MRTTTLAVAFGLATLLLMPACSDSPGPDPEPGPDLSMRYDEQTYLMSHNAFAYFDWTETAPDNGLCVNQLTSIEQQLWNGVRALQLDIHYWDGNDPETEPVVYLCHGTRQVPLPQCAQLKFTPLKDELEVIAEFMAQHPNEVITLQFEDYIGDEEAILGPFRATEVPGTGKTLDQMIYNPSGDTWNVPTEGKWPTIQWLVDNDQRLVVFADPGYEAIAWGGMYFKGNQYDPIGLDEEDCLLKGELSSYDGKGFLMYHLSGPKLMNGWDCPELSIPFTPDQINTSSFILDRWENSCLPALGRPPVYISVDFADGCPTGQDICDPSSMSYSGPLDAVNYFNEEVWPGLRGD